jgi:hypothetical protein
MLRKLLHNHLHEFVRFRLEHRGLPCMILIISTIICAIITFHYMNVILLFLQLRYR